jgi:hypothetical protein
VKKTHQTASGNRTMNTTLQLLVAIFVCNCIGCQAPTVQLHAENTETGQPVTGITVERKAEIQSPIAAATWQPLQLGVQSDNGTIALHLTSQGHLDDLRISAPGYLDSFVHIDWKEMAISFPPQTSEFSFDPSRLPVWLKPLKSLVPNETITRMNQEWAVVLGKVVTPDGYVRWDFLRKNQEGVRDHLFNFIDQLAKISPDNHPEFFPYVKWVRSAALQQAYWLNAYNALSMYWVVQHDYPQSIPRDRPGRFLVGGKLMSFDELEKRSSSSDAPTHLFAINFCARSSAPLRNVPYDGVNLDHQLAEQARLYLHDPRAVARAGDTLKLNNLLFGHRTEFASVVQMQTKAARLAADMSVGLGYYAGSDEAMFKGYKTVANMGFDWSLNRSP